MKKVLILNGPNINLIGVRETGIYGQKSYDEINESTLKLAEKLKLDCMIFQSNCEGELIDKIHEANGRMDAIVINAGAYTHYSIAIRDAIAAVCLPCIEIHVSNIYEREDFRHASVLAPVCAGVIVGFGEQSYHLALHAIKEMDR